VVDSQMGSPYTRAPGEFHIELGSSEAGLAALGGDGAGHRHAGGGVLSVRDDFRAVSSPEKDQITQPDFPDGR
jgi:hypothetical protein